MEDITQGGKTVKQLRSGYFWGTDSNVWLAGTTVFLSLYHFLTF